MKTTKTKKESMWEKLKDLKPGERINMVQLSRDAECSLAHVSSTMRYALESEFLKFDETGNYVINDIPKWSIFDQKTAERASERKAGSPGRKRPSRKISKSINIVKEATRFVKILADENYKLKEENKKLVAYAKKLKKERDDLLSTINL